MVRQSSGFTLTELVTVIVILGILAVVALPRMSTSEYRALEFRDKTVAALRYAQKTATSHRRLVCVAFTATTVDLTIAQANPAISCDAILRLPTGEAGLGTTGASFDSIPDALFFQPDGRGTSDGAGTTVVSTSLTVTGQAPITVVGASGHVQ